ncbi:MAG: ATP-binding protein, partial [Pseudomonadota bacterium]
MPKGAPLGVAVSGGGDSTALLHLAAAWGRETGHPVHAITVDHALRPESAAEAAGIARQAAALGL